MQARGWGSEMNRKLVLFVVFAYYDGAGFLVNIVEM